MKERAELLRRRITLFRRYLAEGVPAELARHYVEQIVADETELGKIEGHGERRE